MILAGPPVGGVASTIGVRVAHLRTEAGRHMFTVKVQG